MRQELSHGPRELRQADDLALQLLNLFRCSLRRLLGGLPLQGLDDLLIPLEHGKVRVHDRIEKRVSEVIGAGIANPEASLPNLLSNALEGVLFFLPEGQKVILAQDDADLLRGDSLRFLAEPSNHDKERFAEIFELWALASVRGILKCMGWNLGDCAKTLQKLGITQAAHIHPSGGWAGHAIRQDLEVGDLLFNEALAIVAHHPHPGLTGPGRDVLAYLRAIHVGKFYSQEHCPGNFNSFKEPVAPPAKTLYRELNPLLGFHGFSDDVDDPTVRALLEVNGILTTEVSVGGRKGLLVTLDDQR